MAGGGNDEDNPVPINVTPLIDIIFCLIIFFMCSFHFKALQGRMDAWMPADRGVHDKVVAPDVLLDEIRIEVTRDGAGVLHRRIGAREIGSDQELCDVISAQEADFRAMNRGDAPVTIDAGLRAPWEAVVHVLDLCRSRRVARVQFASALAVSAP